MDSSEMGKLGGRARAKNMTAAQRKSQAVKAINTRWKRFRAAQKTKKRAA